MFSQHARGLKVTPQTRRAIAAVEHFVYAMSTCAGACAAPCRKLGWPGVTLDKQANKAGGPRISAPYGGVSVCVIPTDEELMIAQHTLALVH
jgi:hypothetical protein